MGAREWRDVAAAQSGLITRAQLAGAGVNCWAVAHRVETERWQIVAPTVIATSTGALTVEQHRWAAVLNAGEGARLGGLSAAAAAGLKNWDREDVTVVVPYRLGVPAPMAGVRYIRSRRDVEAMRSMAADTVTSVPRIRIEPAVLLFAAADRSDRTAQGVLAAAIQQRLTSAESLTHWVGRLAPLRRAPLLRQALAEFTGGAQSLAEVDVARMCRAHRLAGPRRQVKRHGSDGRVRFTDCEWHLPSGGVVVLEVDGLFHMDVGQWESDLARQRSLSASGRIIVRCTARELRETPDVVARDLKALGVPAL